MRKKKVGRKKISSVLSSLHRHMHSCKKAKESGRDENRVMRMNGGSGSTRICSRAHLGVHTRKKRGWREGNDGSDFPPVCTTGAHGTTVACKGKHPSCIDGAQLIRVKMRSLNAGFYVSNKFIINSSNMIFKLEQWQVEVESTGRKVKRLKSEDYFWYF